MEDISPETLIHLAAGLAYFFVGLILLVVVFFKARTEISKSLASILFVLGMAAWASYDAVLSGWMMKDSCEAGTRPRIAKTLSGVTGFSVPDEALARRAIDELGFDFAEVAHRDSSALRFFRDSSGRVMSRKIKKPTTGLVVKIAVNSSEWPLRVDEKRFSVTFGGAEIAGFSNYTSKGSWWQVATDYAIGAPYSCAQVHEQKFLDDIITGAMLKPTEPPRSGVGGDELAMPAFGLLPSIRESASRDDIGSTVTLLAKRFEQTGDPARMDDILEELLQRLTGAYGLPESEVVQDKDKKVSLSAKHAAVLGAMLGRAVTADTVALLFSDAGATYDYMFEKYRAGFLSTTRLAMFRKGNDFDWGMLASRLQAQMARPDERRIALSRLNDVSRSAHALGLAETPGYLEFEAKFSASKDSEEALFKPEAAKEKTAP